MAWEVEGTDEFAGWFKALTDDEAQQLAAFINAKQRPAYPGKADDYRTEKLPVDAVYYPKRQDASPSRSASSTITLHPAARSGFRNRSEQPRWQRWTRGARGAYSGT